MHQKAGMSQYRANFKTVSYSREKGKLMRFRAAILTVCGLVSGVFPALGAVKVGDMAPDFKLRGLDNRDYALSDYRGRVVAVNLLGWN